ncbi:hypothetical protein [Streptomyces toxytricini]|uniref:hypothetical protein n=1 Tax=Streptomyces toxytricini TaxID=67369 RepID=UPI00342960BA
MELREHHLVEKLISLHLPPTDYVIMGSGPLLAHGLRESIGDLDVVARGAAWKIATAAVPPTVAPSGIGQMVLLFNGDIEVFDRWLPGAAPPDELIEGAEFVQGIPFCPLPEVLRWKRKLNREKDQYDIPLIEAYLRSR